MQKLYFLKYSLISILLSVMFRVEAQSNDLYYRSAQNRLTNMLSGKESLNLREAIYCVENAWFNDKLNKKLFTDKSNAGAGAGLCLCPPAHGTGGLRLERGVFRLCAGFRPWARRGACPVRGPAGTVAPAGRGQRLWLHRGAQRA